MSSTSIAGKSDENAPLLRNRIIGFSDWLATLQESSSSSAAPVLDLRSFKEQQRRLLCTPSEDSVSLAVVPIPISDVQARSFELPARHVTFSVLLPESDLDRADSFLCGSNRKRPNPWRVDHVLIDTDELWNKARDLGMVDREQTEEEEQENKRQRLDQGPTPSGSATRNCSKFPFPRLWQPDPMVEKVLFPLLAESHGNSQQSDTQNSTPLEVWDLAAGAGRDVAFLAEELFAAGKPHRIIAVDHRYNEKETKIVNDFWGRRGTEQQTSSVKLNLSHWKTLEEAMSPSLAEKKVAAMFCVRFWKLDLVEAIANSPSIPSGVMFGLSHFCRPSIGAPWNFDHPSEKTVLERNELRDLFRTNWDVLHDDIALDSDHGRTMIHFVAKRR